MADEPSDRVNELLRRYQQGSPGSKKRERVASPSSDSASAKKPLRDDGAGKYDVAEKKKTSDEEGSPDTEASSQDDIVISLVQETHHQREPEKSHLPTVTATEQSNGKSKSPRMFEQSPEPIQPSYKLIQPSYKHDTYTSSSIDQSGSYRSQERPAVSMVTQDDVIISRRRVHTSLDAGHANRQGDERDGEESTESSSSPRATSPESRSKSPGPEPVSPLTSPLERSTPPPRRETSPIDRSFSPEEGSISPVERSVSPAGRPVSPPLDELLQPTDDPKGSAVSKRSATYAEVEDSLAALDAIATGIGQDDDDDDAEAEEKLEVKERSRSTSSLEATDLDFSVIESSSQLDVGASKDRAILRQKGSLAKRRKPTRSSMRSRGNEEDMFTVDIPLDDNNDDLMNGHDDKAKENIEQKERETKKVPAKNSFMLPGLGEQPKLRSKPKVPLPTKTTPVTATVPVSSESTSPVSTTPAWMLEAKQKRQSRTPTEEISSIKRDTDSEKPAWMREALAKKRRSLDLLQKKEMKAKDKTEDSNTTAPWVKERSLKHVDRAPPLEQTTDITNNNAAGSGPDVRNVGGATIFSSVPSTRLESIAKDDRPSKSQVDGEQKLDSSSISKNEKELLNEKDFKNGNNKWLSDSPRSRDLLTPIKHSSVDMNSNPLGTQDENSPPTKTSGLHSEKQTSTVISSLEQTKNADILRNKAQLPPLDKTLVTSNSNNKEQVENEDGVPSWKAEIQQRRRSKVFIPSQKPDQPIKLVETPKWKLDLAERTKNKKDSDVPKPMTEILTQTTTPQPHATPTSVPPWQQELAERKKRNSLNPRALEPLEKTSAKDEPEWAGLAEKRRSRLANSGLVKA